MSSIRNSSEISAYGVNKAIIAEIFGITRSAVTQSCKKVGVDSDLEGRVYRALRGISRNIYATGKNAQENSLILLSALRDIMERRKKRIEAKGFGRPLVQFNFSSLKKLIRSIVATLWKAVAVENIKTVAETEFKHVPPTGKYYTMYLEGMHEGFLMQIGRENILALGGYYFMSDVILDKQENITMEAAEEYVAQCVKHNVKKDYNF